ncbi:MAG TPA: histidine kinase, partial [Gemmatimonadetes bacterium]|nr:histidine kinase [Gemmatimonadota bacterium]
ERLHTEVEFAGTGLGLATALHVAPPHGGDVWAEGSPGDGATFSFSLSL